MAVSKIVNGTSLSIEVQKGNPYEALFLTALYSGLREGELLALTWDDINFKEKYISVTKTLAEVSNPTAEGRGKINWILQTPKTIKGYRKVDVPKFLISILRHHKLNQAENKFANNERYENNNLVFCNRYGKHINSRKLRQIFINSRKQP